MPSLLEHLQRWQNRDPETIREREERKRKSEQAAEAQFQALKDDTIRLTSELLQAEKKEIEAGRPDPCFVLPESAAGLRMSKQQAIEFNKQSAEEFVNSCPDYAAFKNKQSWETIRDYILNQGVMIATAEVFRMAFERCRDLGLLTENPQPVPEPQARVEVQELDPTEAARIEREHYHSNIVAFYAGKGYTQFDLDRLSADEYRKVMGLYGDRLPRFSNVMQG